MCHNGETWLRPALSALRHASPRPRHVLAVDTGSADRTAALLHEATAEGSGAAGEAVLDGVLTLPGGTGFGAAVATAVDAAVQRWGDPGAWVWLLHDDCAPEPDCLGALLVAADVAPSAALLGPMALDWADPRLVVDIGLSTDASGHRQMGVGPTELDSAPSSQSTEVLAVSSAGALVRRDVWDQLGGYDPVLPMFRDDLDFGWRVNRSGYVALCVPAARLRHARAAARGLRPADVLAAAPGPENRSVRSADRAHGLRTLLVNCSTLGFVVGLPRLAVLCLLRAAGFALLRRFSDAGAELRALAYLLSGRAGLRAARASRRGLGGQVRGLLTTRTTRLRNVLRGGLAGFLRDRVAADAALGRLPEAVSSGWAPPDAESVVPRPVGPDALPAGALGRGRAGSRRTAGLRRPATSVTVPVGAAPVAAGGRRPSPRPRPSPGPRDGSARPDLVTVEVGRGRLARELLLAPPLVLFVGLLAVSLLTNSGRLGPSLSGGGVLPAQSLAGTWSGYLAAWHPVGGGTAAPAPAALAVLGALGAVLFPLGGPPAAVAVLLLGDAPLAGLFAYLATRRLPVRRPVRALVAAAYALLPPAVAAVAQGRLDVVVVHVLLPAVLAGVVGVLYPAGRGRRRGTPATSWLSAAACTSLGLAVVGAFSPLVHAIVVLVALGGFVVVPGRAGDGRRRVAALFAVVLLPLALLIPWPAVVLAHPSVLLTGVTDAVGGPPVGALSLAALDPGGPGSVPVVGAVVLLAVVVAVAVRPRRTAFAGLAVAVLGVAAVVVPDQVGAPRSFTGAPLLVVGCGLLWTVLDACRGTPRRRRSRAGAGTRLLAGLAAVAVLGLAGSAMVLGRGGPLRVGGVTLAEAVTSELRDTGRSVLMLAAAGAPTRQAGGRLPGFGDGALATVPGSPERLATWNAELTGGDAASAKRAVAEAAVAGVLFVVLPDRAAESRLLGEVGDLATRVSPASDGRPVVRLQPTAGAATLISPVLAKQAVTGGEPPTTLGAEGISPVSAAPPDVAVRVSEGALGRLLVLAADDEAGWQATVDGQPAPIVRAWGHLVAVSVPMAAADVQVTQPGGLRDVLLLVQAAVLLFTLLTAIPGRPRQP